MSYFGPIMVQDVSTKIGPQGDILKTLCASWIRGCEIIHCVKCFQRWSFFWSLFSCIQSKHRKIRTRKNSVFGHFSQSDYPVDPERKLNVNKTFRRRPGRLIKVLCTFNLRPVSPRCLYIKLGKRNLSPQNIQSYCIKNQP